MRIGWFISVILGSLLLMLSGTVMAGPWAESGRQEHTNEGNIFLYLPLVMQPATVLPGSVIVNGSFEAGWDDMPPAPGYLINQQPRGWTLYWLSPGESMFGSDDKAGGVPEAVHKLSDQLPPEERLDGSDPLILEGETTYKIFHFGAPFGAELSQVISGLEPGSVWRLKVPVRVHLHGDNDPYAAESGVWVNGQGHWVIGDQMGDRRWYLHTVDVVAPADGQVTLQIRFKSKWYLPKDFFIDDVRMHRLSNH